MIIRLPGKKARRAPIETEWHEWFAWRPVIVDWCVVWCQVVWRRKVSHPTLSNPGYRMWQYGIYRVHHAESVADPLSSVCNRPQEAA